VDRVEFVSAHQTSFGTRTKIDIEFLATKTLTQKTEIQLAFEKQDKHFDWSF
jgi:hypothetical protein